MCEKTLENGKNKVGVSAFLAHFNTPLSLKS